MARGIYSHEQEDPDFVWLLNNFKEKNQDCVLIDTLGNPLVIIIQDACLDELKLAESNEIGINRAENEL